MRANKTRAGLLVCLCFLLILGSCKEEEDAVLNLSMSEITFGSKSEVKSVEVYANTSWSAEIVPSASSSWISLNVVSGKSGTSAIQITLTENDTPDERTAEIIFRGSSTSQTLKVTQEKNEILELPYEEIGFWQIGGIFPLEIKRNIAYSVEIEPEAREWMKLVEPKELSSDLIYINIEENFSGLPRIGSVYVKGKDSSLADTLKIYQYPLELSLSRKTLDFGMSAESRTVIVTTSHQDYDDIPLLELKLPEDAKDWCTVEVDNQGILSVSVSENQTGIDRETEVTGILILNSRKYAGTAIMYSNGFSVAACPISGDIPTYDFEALFHHEVGGHAFGRLGDEYRYYGVIPSKDKERLKLWQSYGYYHNLDLTNDLTQILWADFTKIPKYAYVGAFEGGFLYNYGVWRPEYLSCMENNIPYFNAPSRWRIVERIAKLADVPITFDDFVRQDHVSPPTDAMTRAARSRKHIPLGEPILIIQD